MGVIHYGKRSDMETVACGKRFGRLGPTGDMWSSRGYSVTCLDCKAVLAREVQDATPEPSVDSTGSSEDITVERTQHYSDDSLYDPGPRPRTDKRRAICGTIIKVDGVLTPTFDEETGCAFWTSNTAKVTCLGCKQQLLTKARGVSVDRQDEDPELRVHREDCAKQDALVEEPYWPHDCDSCTYIGSEEWDGNDFDLHWCPLTGTPIARYGNHGNYYSGMEFVTTQPMLALAYCRALHNGLVKPGVI